MEPKQSRVNKDLLPVYERLGRLDGGQAHMSKTLDRLAEQAESREERSQRFREDTAASLAKILERLDRDGNTPPGTSSVIARSAQAGPITASVSFGTGWLRKAARAAAAALLSVLGFGAASTSCRNEPVDTTGAPP